MVQNRLRPGVDLTQQESVNALSTYEKRLSWGDLLQLTILVKEGEDLHIKRLVDEVVLPLVLNHQEQLAYREGNAIKVLTPQNVLSFALPSASTQTLESHNKQVDCVQSNVHTTLSPFFTALSELEDSLPEIAEPTRKEKIKRIIKNQLLKIEESWHRSKTLNRKDAEFIVRQIVKSEDKQLLELLADYCKRIPQMGKLHEFVIRPRRIVG